MAGDLSAGDKKDLVLTNRLWRELDRVAIYGWHRAEGLPIQPLSTVHGWRYADYSHGVRLISTQVWVDGVSRPLFDVLQDPQLAGALSSEGVIQNLLGLIKSLNSQPVSSALTAATRLSCNSEIPGDSLRGCAGP
jgi:hypothetical protein